MDFDEVFLFDQLLHDLIEAEDDANNGGARRFYQRQDAFALSEEQFRKNFRLSKDLARHVIELVTPFIPPATRTSALSVETKVLVALHFYGHGSYQEGIGKNLLMGISQPSVSRCLQQISEALNRDGVMENYIHFPHNLEELEELRLRFFRKFQFPGIIGCVDGTHVAIIRPKINEEIFVNRKNYHSLNVQLVCDENLKVISVNAKFPGGSHDSHIWRQSTVSTVLEEIYRNTQNPFYFLGDSGYPLRPWLLTPLQNPFPGTPEWRFNKAFTSIRSTIERCNGVLKNRFRCLLKHRVLHYEPDVAASIVNACVVLHNMCIEHNIPEPDNNDLIGHDMGIYAPFNQLEANDPLGRINHDLAAGRQLRQRIIDTHFIQERRNLN